MTELRGDPAAAKLAAFLLLTGPGTPFLYYGEEIGMTGTKPDERIRTPMRWTADPSTAGFTDRHAVAGAVRGRRRDRQRGGPVRGHDLAAHRVPRPRPGAQRAGGAAARRRRRCSTPTSEPVAAWLRTTADSTVLAIANLSDEPVAGYSLSLADGPLCGPVVGTLLGTVGGDPGAVVSPPVVTAEGGVSGWTPIAELAPRSGYLVELAAAP